VIGEPVSIGQSNDGKQNRQVERIFLRNAIARMISIKSAHFLNIVARPDQLEAGPLLRRAAARDKAGMRWEQFLKRL
jgi:hypothetical protein